MNLKPCPKCGCNDRYELEVDSSSIANASWVYCSYCEYRFQHKCSEEAVVKRWNKIDRTNMPNPPEN